MLTIARATRESIGSGYRSVNRARQPTPFDAPPPSGGASGLEEERVGVVVEGEQLGITGPVDGGLELGGGMLAELRLQALQEIRLGDPTVVVLLQGLVDPADRRVTQQPPGDDFLARRDARVRECLA